MKNIIKVITILAASAFLLSSAAYGQDFFENEEERAAAQVELDRVNGEWVNCMVSLAEAGGQDQAIISRCNELNNDILRLRIIAESNIEELLVDTTAPVDFDDELKINYFENLQKALTKEKDNVLAVLLIGEHMGTLESRILVMKDQLSREGGINPKFRADFEARFNELKGQLEQMRELLNA